MIDSLGDSDTYWLTERRPSDCSYSKVSKISLKGLAGPNR